MKQKAILLYENYQNTPKTKRPPLPISKLPQILKKQTDEKKLG